MKFSGIVPLVVLAALQSPARAADPVKWTARLEPADARSGEGAQVVVSATIDRGFHIYSMTPVKDGPLPTSFTLVAGPALAEGGAAVQPRPVKQLDPNFGKEVEMYSGAVAFGIPVKVQPGLSGNQKAVVKVRFMACNEQLCMPPKTVEVPIGFAVAPGAARAEWRDPVTAVPKQPAAPRSEAPAPPGREPVASPAGAAGGGSRPVASAAAARPAPAPAAPGSKAPEPAGSVGTAAPAGDSPVTWSARLVPADARAGESAQVVLTATIAGTYHIYSLVAVRNGPQPTTIDLVPGPALVADGPAVQPGGWSLDKNYSPPAQTYSRSVSFGLPVRLPADLTGSPAAALKVRFMACTEQHCLPPKTVTVPIAFTVAGGAARADHARPVTSVPRQAAASGPIPGDTASAAGAGKNGGSFLDGSEFGRRVREAQSGGLVPFLWLALSMGFLALLTPCVFPMVPITVSFFAKKQGQTGREGVQQALAYCLGIMATFTGLGLLLSVVFGAAGISDFATNPFVNLAMAALFIVLAVNLFGVYEIALPASFVQRVQAGSRSGRFAGPILMGLAFTLTSFTCTVPFVGTLLVATAQGGALWPVLGMLAFSAAFASPFFLLALFPQWLARIPKSGPWLTSIKAFMGFLELAAAVKFLSNADLVWQLRILTRPVFLSVWSTIAFVAALYLVGWLRLPHDGGPTRYGPARRLLGLLMAAGACYCLAAIGGRSIGELDAFLPPASYGSTAPVEGSGKIPWLVDYRRALAQAQAENKPLFVNFTGYTCTNCRWMEAHVLPLPEVVAELRRFVTVELYTDGGPGAEANQKLQEDLFETVALPLYAVLTPDGKKVDAFAGLTRNPKEFVEFLRRAYAAAQPAGSPSPAR